MLLQYQSGYFITLLGFITFSIELSANFVTFSGVTTFSGNYYIIGCYVLEGERLYSARVIKVYHGGEKCLLTYILVKYWHEYCYTVNTVVVKAGCSFTEDWRKLMLERPAHQPAVVA